MGASAAAIAVMVVVCRVRGLPLRETLGLSWPPPSQVALWSALFLVLVVLSEAAHRALRLEPGSVWSYARPVVALRVVAIVVFAPVAEELLFRGLLFSVLAETRAGAAGAVLVPALLFALLHVQYTLPKIALVLVDGVFFGVVRLATGSTLLPIVLHALGNLYAVLQRLPATAGLPLVRSRAPLPLRPPE